MGFNDDYPLDPPPLSDDWSKPVDRNQYDSLQEVRANLLEVSQLLEGLYRAEVTLPDGRIVTTLIRESGRDAILYGFQVTRKNATTGLVAPSVVTGMGAFATVPVYGGIPLDNDPAPGVSLTPSIEQWVCLRLEVTPDVEEVQLYPLADGEDAPAPTYRIQEGGGTLVGDIEVLVYANSAAMEAASRLPVVNGSAGTVTQTGYYVIPLAKQSADNTIEQLGYHGPLGIRMCASGALVALAPARGTLTDA